MDDINVLESIKHDFEEIRDDFNRRIEAMDAAIAALRGSRITEDGAGNKVIKNAPMVFNAEMLDADNPMATKKPRGGGIRKDI